MPDPSTIFRNETVERRWTVPVEGGYEPISLKVVPEDGVVRLAVGAISTAPSKDELRGLMQACAEAVVTLEGGDVEGTRAIIEEGTG